MNHRSRGTAAVAGLVLALAVSACAQRNGGASEAADAGADRAPPPVGAACALVGSMGTACDPCIAASCCTEYQACFSTAECIDVNDCVATCDESVTDSGPDAGDCPTACKARHPEAGVRFEAWDSCVATKCPTQCER